MDIDQDKQLPMKHSEGVNFWFYIYNRASAVGYFQSLEQIGNPKILGSVPIFRLLFRGRGHIVLSGRYTKQIHVIRSRRRKSLTKATAASDLPEGRGGKSRDGYWLLLLQFEFSVLTGWRRRRLLLLKAKTNTLSRWTFSVFCSGGGGGGGGKGQDLFLQSTNENVIFVAVLITKGKADAILAQNKTWELSISPRLNQLVYS